MATAGTKKRPSRRPSRSSLVRRWLALLTLGLVAFLYYQPLRTYFETRATLAQRSAEVRALEREKRTLERRLAAKTSREALVREARRLGYVKPGERLYIVKGIGAWTRAQAAKAARARAQTAR